MKQAPLVPRHVGGRLKQLLWLARARREPHGIILLYHRVTGLARDPEGMCVSPEHFAEHLEVLRRIGSPVALDEFPAADGQGGRPAVAITFDDGYADNFTNARPLLEKHEIPAIVFVATALVGSRTEMWWDELDDLIFDSESLPASLDLSLLLGNRGEPFWRRGISPRVSSAEAERCRLYSKLTRALRPLELGARDRALEKLYDWVGRGPRGRQSHRIMTADEVQALAGSKMMSVGAHTVNHPVLAALPAITQAQEIARSKNDLEAILGSRVSSFSYPYGTWSSYTRTTKRIVREVGFTRACSNNAAPIFSSTDRFELPRILVRDWDGDEFVRHLGSWFSTGRNSCVRSAQGRRPSDGMAD